MSTPSSVYKYRFVAPSETQQESNGQENKEKPPSIFLFVVENDQEMRQLFEKVADGNEYIRKLYEINKL